MIVVVMQTNRHCRDKYRALQGFSVREAIQFKPARLTRILKSLLDSA